MSLSDKQIIQYLMQGIGVSDLKKKGVNQYSVLAALLSSPDAINKLTSSVSEDTQKYDKFDPTYQYDTSGYNTIRAKYDSYGPQYSKFVADFFKMVDNNGAEPTQMQNWVNSVTKDYDKSSKFYGLDKQTLAGLVETLSTDAPKYVKEKNANQYSAFQKARKTYGAGDNMTATQGRLKELTGFSGLSSLPTSLDEVAKNRADAWAKEAKVTDEAQISQYKKAFLDKATKEKRSALEYGVYDLLKSVLK